MCIKVSGKLLTVKIHANLQGLMTKAESTDRIHDCPFFLITRKSSDCKGCSRQNSAHSYPVLIPGTCESLHKKETLQM